jgi:hypothetical protein
MDWREAQGQKRMAISSADGSARSVAITIVASMARRLPLQWSDLSAKELF